MSIGSHLQKAGSSFVKDLSKTGNSLVDAGKGALEDIADSTGLGKLLRKGPSSDPLKAEFATASIKEDEGNDWRVKLSIPSIIDSDAFAPLKKTGGLCFPFTPTILMSHSANYNALQPIHTNYPFYNYQASQVDDMVITGDFFVQNAQEARYWCAAVHYLRTVTKMFYGAGDNAGNPPPVVKLNGYGDFVFNNVSCIIKNFTVDMPADVDYLKTDFPEGNETYSFVPTQSQVAITLSPIYSRSKTQQFSMKSFINGGYIGNDSGYI